MDGFVLMVPKKKRKAYQKMAAEAGKVWKKFGAVGYYECIEDDLKPRGVKLTFPQLTKAKKDEDIWYSFIIYKSKAHRNSVNKKVMSYFNKKYPDHKHHEMPFDMRRMAYGGFKSLVKR